MGLRAKRPPRQGLCPLYHQRAHKWLLHWFRMGIPSAFSVNKHAFSRHLPIPKKKELSCRRMLGPFPLLQVNKMGVIPKGHTPGKWRLITDLSSPTGTSVNDGIETEVTSLSYITVDNVAQVACDLGRGALLAKVNIENAYRLIPVHPSDRPLQAITWEGNIYTDSMLPFGL